MQNELDNLYRLHKKDVQKAGKVLGEAFFNDPAWIRVIPDEVVRADKLPKTFELTLTYVLKYGEAYSPSSDIEGVALWLPDNKVDMNIWRMIRSGAFRKGLKIGQDIGNRIQKVFEPIDNDRKENLRNKSYLYLQAIGVAPANQAKGFGSELLRPMFKRCDKEGLPIYLETETEINVKIYKKFGFTLLKERDIPDYGFRIWEMIREPKL